MTPSESAPHTARTSATAESWRDAVREEHPPDEIDGAVRQVITRVLGDSPYLPELVDPWCDQILDHSLRRIVAFGRPFKYVATCVISPQSDSVLDTAATAFWDTMSDSLCCTRHGNGVVDCIVTVYSCRR